MIERVQKILSQWGIASRRQAEEMILAGRVKLNGKLVHLGDKANINKDRLEVDNVLLKPNHRPQLVYLLLNKPAGVVSTCHDPGKRPTVLNLLAKDLQQGQGIHPVGRLDLESTGALILTNDGELTLKLTHPRYHLPKTYRVWLDGIPSESVLDRWRIGVLLSDRETLPARITVLKRQRSLAKGEALRDRTLLEIIITEGRNRQIRRVAEQLGFPVLKLHRIAIGSIQLQYKNQPMMPLGHYRFLTSDEINSLKIDLLTQNPKL